MQPGVHIDYKALRRINPQAARRAVLDYLASCGHNIAATARAFGITSPVIYDILVKQRQGDLRDRSRAPKRQPRKTPAAVEERVLAAKNKARLGPQAFVPLSGQIRSPPGPLGHHLPYPTPQPTPAYYPWPKAAPSQPPPTLCRLVHRQTL